MRAPDPTLSMTLTNNIAPVGTSFQGHLTRTPELDDGQEPGKHRIQGVRLGLGFVTEGRGDTNMASVYDHEFPVDDWGRLSVPFQVPVPHEGPISYDGRLIRLRWELTATVMIKRAIDRHLEVPVLVIPANGWGVYDRPHPLPSAPVPPPIPNRGSGDIRSSSGSRHDAPFEPPYEPPDPGRP